MVDNIGLIVRAKRDIFPDTTVAAPVIAGTKGVVYSTLPEVYTQKDACWFVIFQSGEGMDFDEEERGRYLEVTTQKISGSDKNRLHNKKMDEVINDVKHKRIKL